MLAKNSTRLFCFFLLILMLTACNPIPNVSPTDTSGPMDLNKWVPVSTGVEVRKEDWKSPANEDTVTIVRMDPKQVKLSIGYEPDKPRTMNQWMQQEKATAIINGGYFDKENVATALIITEGHAYGQSYTDRGGLFAVDGVGAVTLRSLVNQPYDPNNDQFTAATESAPMLVLKGKRTTFQADAAQNRRSIVAVDQQGRLLFIASPGRSFSIDEMADLLKQSDLNIDSALNLDGGSSTALYASGQNQQITIDAFTKLPIVIIAKAR